MNAVFTPAQKPQRSGRAGERRTRVHRVPRSGVPGVLASVAARPGEPNALQAGATSSDCSLEPCRQTRNVAPLTYRTPLGASRSRGASDGDDTIGWRGRASNRGVCLSGPGHRASPRFRWPGRAGSELVHASTGTTLTLAVDRRPGVMLHRRVRGMSSLDGAPVLCAAIEDGRSMLGPDHVIVDLSGVDFCDSTGLRALLNAAREVAVAGGELIAIVPGKRSVMSGGC